MRNIYHVFAHSQHLIWSTGLLAGLLIYAPAAQAQGPYTNHRLPIANPNNKPPSFGQQPSALPAIKQAPASGTVTTNSLTTGQGDDVQLFPSGNPQAEVHISIDKSSPCNLIASANNNPYMQGYYYSHDGGQTWQGNDNLPNSGQSAGDPSTAYDAAGNAYLATMTRVQDGFFVQSSTDKGNTWTNQVRGSSSPASYFDKEMIAADNTPSSPYANSLYTAWNEDYSGTIQFNRSTNRGQSFSTPLVLATTNGNALGANVQTGPNGEVYVCWANYPPTTPGNPVPANSIGFVRSTNGGASFTPSAIAFNIAGMAVHENQPDPVFGGSRVNDLPAMAVDKGSTHRGRIYIVHNAKENGTGKSVVLVRYSDNQGASWSTPVTASIPTGRQNWMPWIAVDDSNGDVSVVYYSFDTSSGYATNTYVAYSRDGGASFNNLKVSDVSHTTAPIESSPSKFAAGYAGDYIGITAYGSKVYPTWMDNRSGTWQLYTSPVSYDFITGPDQLCSSSSNVPFRAPTASANWNWQATPANLFTTSTASGSQIVTSAAAGAQGTGTITATLPGACAPILTKTVQVGAYPITGTYYENGYNTLSSFNYVTTGTVTMYVQAGTGNTYSFATQFPTTTVYQNTPGSNTAYFYVGPGNGNNNRVQINVTASGSGVCGTSTTSSFQFYVPQTQAIAASPNPATSELAIQTVQPTDAPQFSTPIPPPPGQSKPLPVDANFTVQLYNSYGQLVKTGKSQQGKLKLNVLDLPNGLYTLRSGEGKEVISEHIQIAH
ncbi:T9SS type A sorting domain-containing protein [Hymenobacter sp. PAMC 26628]|uniref:T9SS type A sorting domain-containing protein n=1 Tax=Hymenobacter sp. PAMC 26628 TaxID=1484118 RepID=UPI000AEF0431|nr:T9SS type A sorting domain-containing protein [Hymenobacter sp. PAMC 26628]